MKIIEVFSLEEVQKSFFDVENVTPFILNKNNLSHKITTNKDTKKALRVIINNPTCNSCGVKGNIFILSQDKSKNSFGFFYITPKFELVRLTIDHIIPKSMGGTNKIDNLQVLCYNCNQEKAGWLLTTKQLGSIIELKKLLESRQKPRTYIKENLTQIKSLLSVENKHNALTKQTI